MDVHVVGVEVELAQQQLEHLLADAGLHLEPHGAAEAPAAQLHLDGGEQVVGLLLLRGEVGVAGDPEHACSSTTMPGNRLCRCAAITCSTGTKRAPSGRPTSRGSSVGHLDPGEPPLAACRGR